jgi:hypothetical protein
MTDADKLEQTSVNDSGTKAGSDTPLTQESLRPVRGFVYFIGCGEYIKIGFSSRPLDRLRALQTSHPDELEILGTIRGTRQLESKLHKRFADDRERGEWFQASDALWDYIDRNTIERKTALPELSPAARAMVSKLTRLRCGYDAQGAIGHAYSNLIEQVTAMDSYVRPQWATHECQTLPWMIKRQMADLQRLRA